MTLRTWRFATIMLTALAMSTAFCHLLELPPKMKFDAPLYVMLHRTLYPNFGRIGGTAEGLAVIAVVALAIWVCRRHGTFALTAVAAACMVLAHAVFWIVVHPANLTMASWPLDAIPAEWPRWRDQWEYGHAARAFLMVGALAALVLSVLCDRPTRP